MAAQQDTQELKRQAIANLAASRAEVSAEMRHLREDMNPKAFLCRATHRHKAAVVCAAVGTAAATALLVYRHKHPAPGKRIRSALRSRTPEKSGITSQIVRLLAGALVPALIKSVVTAPLANLHKPPASPENPAR